MTSRNPVLAGIIAIAGLAAFLIAGTPALAETVFTTFPYTTGSNWGILGSSRPGGSMGQGVKFTPSANYTFDSAQVELYYSGFYGNSVSFALTSNDSLRGCPGAVLETFPAVSVSTGTSLITFNSTLHPELSSGVTYWLTGLPASSTTDVNWYCSSTATGNAYQNNNGTWGTIYGGPFPLPVAAIAGTPVPEPASLSLLILAGGGLLLRRRRRSR